MPPRCVTASRPAGKVWDWRHFHAPAQDSWSQCSSRVGVGLTLRRPPEPLVMALPGPSRVSGQAEGGPQRRERGSWGEGAAAATQASRCVRMSLRCGGGKCWRPRYQESQGVHAGGRPAAAPDRPCARRWESPLCRRPVATSGGPRGEAGGAEAPGEREGITFPAPRRPPGRMRRRLPCCYLSRASLWD